MLKYTNHKSQITKGIFVFCILYFGISEIGFADESYVYDSGGKRDPFIALVGERSKGAVMTLEDILTIEDVSFQGVAGDAKGNRVAIINGEMVKEGVTVGKLTVKKIYSNRAVILIDAEEHVVSVFEETGGF